MAQALFFQLAFFLLTTYSASQTIVTNLPGFDGELPFKMETGYIGVEKKEDVQLFYYFFQSKRNPSRDPLMLWITGGPGCSSFSGLVYEIGPIAFDIPNCRGRKVKLAYNKYSWTRVANIIFIDAPVGTGYSYANTSEGYVTSDSLSAEQCYEFLRKWLLLHPQYLSNPLLIGGDSYSGKFVPILTKVISDGNIIAHKKPFLNLKGYIVGNPVTDEVRDHNKRIEYAFRVGLISEELYEAAAKSCKGEYIIIEENNTECLTAVESFTDVTGKVNEPHIEEPYCADYQRPPAPHAFSNKKWCRNDEHNLCYTWCNDHNVQKSLNIREGTKVEWVRCNKTVSYTKDILSAYEYHVQLSKRGYRALIYSGDQDFSIPYIATLSWIKTLNLTIADDWRPWFVDGQVAGYTIRYSQEKFSLTFSTIKNGGHEAPAYQPKECFAMFDRWIADYAL